MKKVIITLYTERESLIHNEDENIKKKIIISLNYIQKEKTGNKIMKNGLKKLSLWESCKYNEEKSCSLYMAKGSLK